MMQKKMMSIKRENVLLIKLDSWLMAFLFGGMWGHFGGHTGRVWARVSVDAFLWLCVSDAGLQLHVAAGPVGVGDEPGGLALGVTPQAGARYRRLGGVEAGGHVGGILHGLAGQETVGLKFQHRVAEGLADGFDIGLAVRRGQ